MAFSPVDSALTGPFFADDAVVAVFADRARLARYVRVETALAKAQGHRDLAEALAKIEPGAFDAAAIGKATADAAVPSIPFLDALRARLPADLAVRLHQGATSQDLIDTEMALALREADAVTRRSWAKALDGFAGLAARHRDLPMMGRTYNKRAAPITYGHKAAQWGLVLAEALDAFPAPVFRAALGGAVGTLAAMGDGAPGIARRFAEELGLEPAEPPAHQSRAPFVSYGLGCAMAIGAAAKIATDILYLQSDEVGEVAEPTAPGRGGSSAMAHKRNPVGCTAILAAHMAASGHAATLIQSMAGALERPAGAWHAEWLALGPSVGFASGAARELAALANGLDVDPARLRANLDAAGEIGRQPNTAARWVDPALARIRATRQRMAP
ncbi:MAG: lyase family protein [Tagaea sp.]|nr:lyase family protein [Tagaea sp.]